MRRTSSVLLLLAGVVLLHAEDPLPQLERLKTSPVLQHLKLNPTSGTPQTEAAKTVAQMYVPEGFKVEVVAAEPLLHQPVAFAWDERGRIWVAEAYSYPTKRPAGEGLDKIVIFSDEDGDGQFETRKVFAENLNLVSGLEIGHDGVWVGAAPELLFIADRNRDDKPDGAPVVMLDGFGYQDTHETLNSFLWGPDGWLYGIQGVFNTARIGKPNVPASERPELRAGVWRFHPVRHEFEIFAHGGSNPWGLDYDENGQMFMTHCRSYWGRGPTTHVIQGGQFWNQVNANYAPFIVANPPEAFPDFRNYLLASARYDHGAGGAGVRGSDAIYGGHSHVGTMIYLGDNWPDEYRGHVFTHNLGGHQINQQINKPLGSGYDTVHAGKDMLFCTDPKYVAVDLQYGPDGAVYSIDWYDQQHCHNPNTERWDRGNGRLYRMQWQATYKPVKVDLSTKSDAELITLLGHKNQWYARTAKRLLYERAQKGANPTSIATLKEIAFKDSNTSKRLNAIWSLHAVAGDSDDDVLLGGLKNDNEFVRAWTVQFLVEDGKVSNATMREFARMAKSDASPVVQRYLASAIQRVNHEQAWDLIEALAQRKGNEQDRNLPYLLWHGMALTWSNGKAPAAELKRALTIAKQTALPQLTSWINWYAATLEGDALNGVVESLKDLQGKALHERLAGLWLAMEPRANVKMPQAWSKAVAPLYKSDNVPVQRLAEQLAAAFGDNTAFPRLRETLGNDEADLSERKHAFAVLSRAQDAGSLDVFLGLLDSTIFRVNALNLLPRFDSPKVAQALLAKFNSFNDAEQSVTLNALTSRASFANALLDAVAAGKLKRDYLTAFHVRQLTSLNDKAITERVTATWGRINQSPTEKKEKIDKLEVVFNEAPLWAYSGSAGRQHFQRLCMQCHKLGEDGVQLGPELTGAGKHGIRYFLENIIDPDGVIGTDFQMTTVETKGDDVISGLLVAETPSALTIRTTAGETVIPKANITSRATSEKSLMPEGLLESLNDREQIELLKFLTTN